LCVVVASTVQDEDIDRWSEASVLIWPIQLRLWLTLRWWITRHHMVFILRAFTAQDRGSIRYLAHDDVSMVMDGDDISIRSTEEMEKYESLRQWEFGHTRIYDVNFLERVGMDEELPLIL
jgi:hypothetical protein